MTGRNIFYPQLNDRSTIWNGILKQPNAWITSGTNKSSFDNNLTDADKRKSRMREKRKLRFLWTILPCCESVSSIFLFFISCFLIAALILAVVLPIWLISLDTASTTNETISTLTTTIATMITTVFSSPTTNTTIQSTTVTDTTTTTTTTSTTTTVLVIANVVPSTSIASNYYGSETLLFNCSTTVTNLTIQIFVSKSYGATYNAMYGSYWGGTVTPTYTTNSTYIIYKWTIISGQSINCTSGPYTYTIAFNSNGTAQVKSGDTYSVSAANSGGVTNTLSGYF